MKDEDHKLRKKKGKIQIVRTHSIPPIPSPPHHEEFEEEPEPPVISFNITTISNSRIDKPATLNHLHKANEVIVEQPRRGGFIMASTRPLKNVGISTAGDEFGYDYETYMYHVTSGNNPIVKPPPEPDTSQEVVSYLPPDPQYCTFGLELLDLSDTVVIKQCHSLPAGIQDIFQKDGIFPANPFEISTKSGSPIFFMAETTNCINRLISCGWIGLSSSFSAKVIDVCGKHTMDISNVGIEWCCCCCILCCCADTCNCCCCCCCSSNRDFRVTLVDGEVIGSVGQTRGDHCNPGFELKDGKRVNILQAGGPKCSICKKLSFLPTLCCCFSCLIDDDVFYFAEPEGKLVATVKKSKVLIFEFGGDIDPRKEHHVVIDFVPELDVRVKSLILSAGFVIDFLYWQSND